MSVPPQTSDQGSLSSSSSEPFPLFYHVLWHLSEVFLWLRVWDPILALMHLPQSKVNLLLHFIICLPWEECECSEGQALVFWLTRVSPALFLLAHSRCSLKMH